MGAKTKTAKKRRLMRARAHQKLMAGKSQFFNALEQAGGQPLVPYQKDIVKAVVGDAVYSRPLTAGEVDATDTVHVDVVEPPNRTKCPICKTSQKVRKDGTFGKHDAIVVRGSLTMKNECLGVGQRWDS